MSYMIGTQMNYVNVSGLNLEAADKTLLSFTRRRTV